MRERERERERSEVVDASHTTNNKHNKTNQGAAAELLLVSTLTSRRKGHARPLLVVVKVRKGGVVSVTLLGLLLFRELGDREPRLWRERERGLELRRWKELLHRSHEDSPDDLESDDLQT